MQTGELADGPPPHDCPNCGAPGVKAEMLACKPCWNRLPVAYQRAVNKTWRNSGRSPGAHRAAMAAAMRWWERNPA